MTFAELLRGLDAGSALGAPEGDYTHGEGLAAHTLVRLLVSEETPATARIAAAREIADRCEGRPRQKDAATGGELRLNTLRLDLLSDEEAPELHRLILKALPPDKRNEEWYMPDDL